MNAKLAMSFLLAIAFPVSVLAEWELTPPTGDYGDVEVGSSSTKTFTLTNLSEALTLEVYGIEVLDTSNFAQTRGPSGPLTIQPLETISVEVTFAPIAAGDALGYLYITTDDSSHSQEVVILTGNAVESTTVPPADPSINGNIKGIELCPQFICGRALFAGYFLGEVGGQLAFGTWSAAVKHKELDELIEPVDPEGVTGGYWTLRTWVFNGFFPARQRFSGEFEQGFLNTLSGNRYQALVPMTVTSGGTGRVDLDLELDENTLPQPVTGDLTTPSSTNPE